jgi:hypothetical protein
MSGTKKLEPNDNRVILVGSEDQKQGPEMKQLIEEMEKIGKEVVFMSEEEAKSQGFDYNEDMVDISESLNQPKLYKPDFTPRNRRERRKFERVQSKRLGNVNKR